MRDSRRRLTGYVRNNLHRIDCPTYVKNGWQIGSGVIESACKTVVCRWMKQRRDALAGKGKPCAT